MVAQSREGAIYICSIEEVRMSNETGRIQKGPYRKPQHPKKTETRRKEAPRLTAIANALLNSNERARSGSDRFSKRFGARHDTPS
jgi:hypothetical protein